MTRMMIFAMTAAALAANSTMAAAADDRGLELHQPFQTRSQQSLGGQASLTIRFGGNQSLEERTQLSLVAGPAIAIDRPDGRNLIVGDLASLRFRPSGELSFALANTEVAGWQPVLRAQEEDTEEDDDDTVETVLTGGAIALGVFGVVVAAGFASLIIACNSPEGCGE
ncbi:hypothetical protein HFP57_13005 [Parasphingopyxis algicola]|uniref:hypothetical protein n=1 Tax=Parasphingopyxis algicola TaxID=2026624 RepID=UPI0015A1069C|nr:hypothetical protein [Parasphingopyxis algicola]QLC25850.1 hypothetical protein HFP57_13005 [Parasphingopyxis algicola]